MHKVAVLMSTYNGEEYLREQIESILAQEDVDVTLYIRDDGSSDSTIEIVQEYQKKHSNIKLDVGNNMGVGNSFMQLVYDCPDEYDYYAFSDQDDVWLPEKLKKAVEMIEECEKPVLYCSNQVLVDKDLKIIGMRHNQKPDISYKQIMCQNKITGCTMVWNKAMNDLLSEEKRRPTPELLRCRIHDVWVAMVASVSGIIKYDDKGYILYRQHENNVVGVRKDNLIKEWIKKLKDTTQRNGRSLICSELSRTHKEDAIHYPVIYCCKDGMTMRAKLFLIRNAKEIRKHTQESIIGLSLKIAAGLY